MGYTEWPRLHGRAIPHGSIAQTEPISITEFKMFRVEDILHEMDSDNNGSQVCLNSLFRKQTGRKALMSENMYIWC